MKRLLSLIIILTTSFVFAAEDSMYDFSWLDQDKEVYVLQNRKFRKKGNLYVGATGGKSLAGAFIDSTEANLLGGYFFSENWGLELSYTKANGVTNNTHDIVNAQGASVAFFRRIDTAASAMLMWSPFYSKINTFNKIFYYDWMFGAGVSSVATEDNRNEYTVGPDQNVLTKETISGLTWMTAIRIYITPSWSTRIDFKANHLNADVALSGTTDTEKQWAHYYNFNVGLNYAF
jgi:outer membrane beta-barrel protein